METYQDTFDPYGYHHNQLNQLNHHQQQPDQHQQQHHQHQPGSQPMYDYTPFPPPQAYLPPGPYDAPQPFDPPPPTHTPDTFPYTLSPTSTLTDDEYSTTSSGYLYGEYLEGEDGTVSAAADSSSTTSPENGGGPGGVGGKIRKRRSPQVQVRQRRAANERERRRMQSINRAFDQLRTRIPTLPYEKKLSKVDTLRVTIGYIHMLTDMVQQSEDGAEGGGLRKGGRTSKNHGRYGQPPVKKVIIDCHSQDYGVEDESGSLVPVRGHSLSWNRDANNAPTPNNSLGGAPTLRTKIWVPQFPPPTSTSASPTNNHNSNNNNNNSSNNNIDNNVSSSTTTTATTTIDDPNPQSPFSDFQ